MGVRPETVGVRSIVFVPTQPYKFIGFGDIYDLKPYKFIGFAGIYCQHRLSFLSGPLAFSDSRILPLGLGPENFETRPRRTKFQPPGPGETFV